MRATRFSAASERPPAQIGLVEHVLAALAGLRIDNCLVELNAPEPPALRPPGPLFPPGLKLPENFRSLSTSAPTLTDWQSTRGPEGKIGAPKENELAQMEYCFG